MTAIETAREMITPGEQLFRFSQNTLRNRMYKREKLLKKSQDAKIHSATEDAIRSFVNPAATRGLYPPPLDQMIERALQPSPVPSIVRDWHIPLKLIDALPPEIPLLPYEKLSKILNSPCPMYRGRQIHETHYLFLFPEGPLVALAEKIRTYGLNLTPVKEFPILSDFFPLSEYIQSQSRWGLVCPILPGSERRSYTVQASMIGEVSREASRIEEHPVIYRHLTAVEAIAAHFFHFITTDENLFKSETTFFTKVQDTFEGGHIEIGAEGPDLHVSIPGIFPNSCQASAVIREL